MSKTYLDELTEYPSIAIKNIGEDKTVVGLLLDDPTVEVGSEKADSVFDRFLFDYDYVDLSCQESAAFVSVEAEMPEINSPTLKT